MALTPWKGRTHQTKIDVPKGVKNVNRYKDLMVSINKIFCHNRQLSYDSRYRNYLSVENLARYLADQNLGKLRNISNRHLAEYTKTMQERGLAASTIKTNLAGIRFVHDQIPDARHRLCDNAQLKERYGVILEKRVIGKVDRAWQKSEYRAMIQKAGIMGRQDIYLIFTLAREQGLRLHEAVRLDRNTVKEALQTGILHVIGKGGLHRYIPVRPEGRRALQKALERAGKNQKLFVPEQKNAKQVMKSVQNFVINHRGEIQNPDKKINLTTHGLRHTYAREQYWTRIHGGMERNEALRQVSELLGHHRPEITLIYIFGPEIKEESDGEREE